MNLKVGGPLAEVTATEREKEVLVLVANGKTNHEIAEQLWITVRTVKHHMTGLLRKLGARDRAHLIALSFQLGLLQVNCTEGPSLPPECRCKLN